MHIVSLRTFCMADFLRWQNPPFPHSDVKGMNANYAEVSFCYASPLPLSTKLILVSAAVNIVSQRRFPITTDGKRVHGCMQLKSKHEFGSGNECLILFVSYNMLQHARRQRELDEAKMTTT